MKTKSVSVTVEDSYATVCDCGGVGIPRVASYLNGRQSWSLRNSSRSSYVMCRGNGESYDDPPRPFPEDGNFTWIKGHSDGSHVHGVKEADGEYHYEVRYNQGPGDEAWMEEKDKNYLFRIEDEGSIEQMEPAIWYLRRKENATNNIRDWWTQKLLLPNLSQILEEADQKVRSMGAVAFLSGQHPRLGVNSPIKHLPRDSVERIVNYGSFWYFRCENHVNPWGGKERTCKEEAEADLELHRGEKHKGELLGKVNRGW